MSKNYYRIVVPIFAAGIPPVVFLDSKEYVAYSPIFLLMIGVFSCAVFLVKSKMVLEIIHAAVLYLGIFALGLSLSNYKYAARR